MSLRINQNVAAMNSYRNLSSTENQLSKSLERLSSGFRINRAADDAAGLAISEGLRSQIGGLKVAVRNSQDGISVVQTAEGALNETHSILQRMRDLSVQAANSGSLTDDAKATIQSEVQQLKAELTRIADTTKFNGKALLDGAYTSSFQVGANVGEKIDISISQGMTAKALGLETIDLSKAADALADIVGVTTTGTTSAGTDATTTAATAGRWRTDADYVAPSGAAATYSITVDGGTAWTVSIADGADLATAVAAINGDADNTGAAAVVASADNGKLLLTSATTGASSSVAVTGAGAGTATTGTDAVTTAATKATYTADIDFTKAVSGTLTLGDKSVDLGKALSPLAADATADEKAAAVKTALTDAFGTDYDVTLANDGKLTLEAKVAGEKAAAFELKGSLAGGGADAAITAIDSAIKAVSSQRADLGALQNRIEHTINNLNVIVENLSASESRIRDADMAQEMMQYTRNQMLSQAGTAMLAQAMQVSQSVLNLLR